MTKPTIHLNGTSREALSAGYKNAAVAIEDALNVLAVSHPEGAAPHGRDYYPQGENAYRDARKEHEARLQKLRDVVAELVELYEHCESAGRG
jgi:hypothetical protein